MKPTDASTPPVPNIPLAPVVSVVVVHGIGDQVRNSTVQQVVAQFSRHYQPQGPASLGAFNAGPVQRFFKTNDGVTRRFDFSEAYWADIPRGVATEGYTLEETKGWASLLVERLEFRDHLSNPGKHSHINYPLVRQVVGEMVDTIGVLERLTYLADKAGFFSFDLNKVLVDYLDDVQLVAEFKMNRDAILKRFQAAMENTAEGSDIVIIAHSEGTVVSFLGLLDALWKDPTPPWLKRVRAYMTLGSPIDKHLVLWPELFPWTKPPVYQPSRPEQKIRWRNYYDYGDPVGFELDFARDWLSDDCRKVEAFEFLSAKEAKPNPGHDIGFARYPLPGKAHTDYWTDGKVFDHFIDSAVDQKTPASKGPSTLKSAWFVAYIVGYGLPLVFLIAGVFFMVRSISSFNSLVQNSTMADTGWMFRDVPGIAALMAGITVLSRIPRLTNPHQSFRWSVISLLVFAGFASIFWMLTGKESISAMGQLPLLLLPEKGLDGLDNFQTLKLYLITFGFLLATAAAWASRTFVRNLKGGWSCGSKPLILLGSIAAIAMVISLVNREGTEQASLLPVLLSLAGLIYLWWLAILFFDLIFVWHRYIRHEVAGRHMERIASGKSIKASSKKS